MAWWAWLLVGWAVAACAAGLWIALALRLAEQREWLRRGGVERRQRPRHPTAGMATRDTRTAGRRGWR